MQLGYDTKWRTQVLPVVETPITDIFIVASLSVFLCLLQGLPAGAGYPTVGGEWVKIPLDVPLASKVCV